METLILEFIRMRMLAMGITGFHFRPAFITVAANSIVQIQAQNQYLYFFDVNSQAGDMFMVRGDTEVITQDCFVLSGVPYLFYEMTGNVTIDTTGAINPQTFLYIRVLPEQLASEKEIHQPILSEV
jgi:hypothetical protein